MTREEYVKAFIDGAKDAWQLAQESPSCLDRSYLETKGAASILQVSDAMLADADAKGEER